jgi:hypothetical protein
MLPSPVEELKGLRRTLAELTRRFIDPHAEAAPGILPSREAELDCRAYIVLAHAALEQYFETLALWVLHKIRDGWILRRRSTVCLAALMLSRGAAAGDEEEHTLAFDRLRAELQEAVQDLSKAVYENHGASMQHLRRLFYPLGVDIPDDARWKGSLETLSRLRGEIAHRRTLGATVIPSATDLRQIVLDDCSAFAAKLASTVRQLRPG